MKNRLSQLVLFVFAQLLALVDMRAIIIGQHDGGILFHPDGNASLLLPASSAPNYLGQLRLIGLFTFLMKPKGAEVFDAAYAAYAAVEGETLEGIGETLLGKVSQK